MKIKLRIKDNIGKIFIRFRFYSVEEIFQSIIKYSAIFFVFLSVLTIVLIFYDAVIVKGYRLRISNIEYIKNFLNLFSSYKEVFIATFSLLTIYVALRQFFINQESKNATLKHLTITSDEINRKSMNQKKYNSLELCDFFYTKFQPDIVESFKKLANHGDFWEKQKGKLWDVNNFTKEYILRKEPEWENEFDNLDNDTKTSFALLINKLEVFSLNILDGDIDKDLIYKTLGDMYKLQIQILYPFISIFRTEKKTKEQNFMNKSVELYRLWINYEKK